MSADRLTLTEAAVVVGWGKGMSNREIARELRVSFWTVHSLGKRIRGKLGVHTAAGAVGAWERYRRA